MAEKYPYDLIFNKKVEKEFAVDSINCLVWELGIEFAKALTDGAELNFDKSSLHCNIKKKIYPKVTLNLTVNIEY